MRALWVAALPLAACSFPRASDNLTCSIDDDCTGGRVCEDGFCVIGSGDQPDAPPPPSDTLRFDCAQWTGPRHFDPCMIPQPTGALTLNMAGAYTYDTGTGQLTDPASGVTTPTNMPVDTGMLISIDKLEIASGSSLRVIGPKPLIVAAWTTIDVTGEIDAGSKHVGNTVEAGAGSNPTTECAMHAATNGQASGAGAGGAGGAGFQGRGGDGGDGDGGANGVGGALVAAPLLLGGCTGATGGAGDLPGGLGGAGGGAIQLTAKQGISITGKINAGGAGGEPGGQVADGGGGGGGGSGGMIGLEALTIAINTGAILAVNGGGGGEGGATNPGARGSDAIASSTRTPGGVLNGAGDGGLGSGGATLIGGVGGNDIDSGGGGGGGAAGYITLTGTVTKGTVVISPPETVIP